jgi:outer membrane receptor for ferrienterochelin and colicins
VQPLVLNAGARLDRDPRFDPVISPRAAASLGIWNGGTARAIYSQAFRAPNFFESSSRSPVIAPAEDLEAETVRSVEASIEQRFGTQRVFFGVFRTWWKNLIKLRLLSFEEALQARDRGLLASVIPGVDYAQHQNVADIENYGFNAGLEGSLLSERLRYGLNFSEAYAREQTPGNRSEVLTASPRLSANARLAYAFGGELPTLALAGYLLPPRVADRGSAGFEPVPVAPTQVDLRATVTGRVPFVKGLSYRLSGDYMFGNRGPHLIGPVLVPTTTNPSAELVPLARFRASFGLEYSFLTQD